MLMTSAGTIPAQKFLIIGLGIAGLQAAATAKRLGAIVFAYDTNPQTAEQAISVGAKFIDKTELCNTLPNIDIIICSLPPFNKKTPYLLNKTDLSLLKKQCIIIDMGGNTVAADNNITIIRNTNLASLVANTASSMFAENIYNFLSLEFNFSDEIIAQSCINKGDKKCVY
jgi:NAD(P) transhydrogenase subunit alpha